MKIDNKKQKEIEERDRMILLLGLAFAISWLIAFVYNPILMSVLALLVVLGVIAYV